VPVASVEVAGVASAAGTAGAAVLNGGIITMFADEAKNAWDELFDKYGAELLKDSRQRSTDAVYVRVSPREKAIVKAFAKETGLDMTTILRIALKFLRDKVRPSG
jgi:hypothetical protein